MFKSLILLMVMGGAGSVLAGFFPQNHPAFGSLAVFRLHLAIGLLVLWPVLALLGRRVSSKLALVGAVLAWIGMLPTLVPPVSVAEPDLVGYQHNLRYDNGSLDQVEAAIRALDPDFVMLQEMSAQNRKLLDIFRVKYPHQVDCEFAGIGGVAILTRLKPFGNPVCHRGHGLAWTEVQTSDGTVTLATAHLPWPWPYEQAGQVDFYETALREAPGRVILAGDFNNVTWSGAVKRIAAASRARVVQGLRLTFHDIPVWPGLPIDQVLVSPDIGADVRRLEKYGSDHNALEIRLKF